MGRLGARHLYNVKRSTSASGPWTTAATTTSTTATVTGLTNGTLTYFVVTFLTPDGESLPSSTVSATPLAAPAAPTGLKATPGVKQVSLAWSAATGASGYNIYRTPAGGAAVKAGTLTTRTYSDTRLTTGASLCYTVVAYNTNKTEGPASTAACVAVK